MKSGGKSGGSAGTVLDIHLVRSEREDWAGGSIQDRQQAARRARGLARILAAIRESDQFDHHVSGPSKARTG